MIWRKTRACWWACHGIHGRICWRHRTRACWHPREELVLLYLLRSRMIKLFPYSVFLFAFSIVLVECHDVHDSLWVLFLLFLGYAILLQRSLPFLRKTLPFTLAYEVKVRLALIP